MPFLILFNPLLKIMPRRLTGNSKKWQERVEVAIKRARHMALIPYIVDRKKVVDSPFKQH
ncbi:hypothetical protein HpBT226_09070 [Helicobacter pylori]